MYYSIERPWSIERDVNDNDFIKDTQTPTLDRVVGDDDVDSHVLHRSAAPMIITIHVASCFYFLVFGCRRLLSIICPLAL